jgi:hypothetical protein
MVTNSCCEEISYNEINQNKNCCEQFKLHLSSLKSRQWINRNCLESIEASFNSQKEVNECLVAGKLEASENGVNFKIESNNYKSYCRIHLDNKKNEIGLIPLKFKKCDYLFVRCGINCCFIFVELKTQSDIDKAIEQIKQTVICFGEIIKEIKCKRAYIVVSKRVPNVDTLLQSERIDFRREYRFPLEIINSDETINDNNFK